MSHTELFWSKPLEAGVITNSFICISQLLHKQLVKHLTCLVDWKDKRDEEGHVIHIHIKSKMHLWHCNFVMFLSLDVCFFCSPENISSIVYKLTYVTSYLSGTEKEKY